MKTFTTKYCQMKINIPLCKNKYEVFCLLNFINAGECFVCVIMQSGNVSNLNAIFF